MHFLPDVYVPCDVCHGKRYNRETLEVQYKGKNITEVLDMTVEEAHEFFKPVPVIARKLQTLLDVGLGYIQLGQSATTLSGGEAQRVKLSLELSKRDTGRTLYILDEPTTGLHFHDIDLLLKVIHRLRDQGNTRGHHRAQPGRDQDRRLDDRPRPRRRRRRRPDHRQRHAGGGGEESGQLHRQIPGALVEEEIAAARQDFISRRAITACAQTRGRSPDGHPASGTARQRVFACGCGDTKPVIAVPKAVRIRYVTGV